eukprot:PhM_4_TR3188/c0_g1_i2/m.58985
MSSSLCFRRTPLRLALWNEIDNWCTLCNQPHNSWEKHRSVADHVCTDMCYESIRAYSPRAWTPHVVYSAVMSSSSSSLPLSSYSCCTGLFHDSFESTRIQRLHYGLKELVAIGALEALTGGYDKYKGNTVNYQRGHRCCKILVARATHALFPESDSGQLSSFLQMALVPPNCEAVYEMIQLPLLMATPVAARHQPVRGTGGYSNAVGEKIMNEKRAVVRALAGDLWLYVHDRDMLVQPRLSMSLPKTYHRVLAQYCLWALVAELMLSRLKGYGVLADRAWRERGCVLDDRFSRPGALETRFANLGCPGLIVTERKLYQNHFSNVFTAE